MHCFHTFRVRIVKPRACPNCKTVVYLIAQSPAPAADAAATARVFLSQIYHRAGISPTGDSSNDAFWRRDIRRLALDGIEQLTGTRQAQNPQSASP
jgi:hypothetical protein